MNLLNKSWQAALSIIEKLESVGFEAVVVGGAVRDYLLQRDVHDVDVATSALPSEVKEVFPHTVDVGIEHGTVLVLQNGTAVEVTTFRTDGQYEDYRRPASVQFVRSLEQDLLRRDFTMNAIAMRKDFTLIDYYGGQTDIANGIIRAVGQPAQRFQEDALRMLRAIRFAAQLGFTVEESTLTAIQENAQTLQHIAHERIKAELDKMWVSKYIDKGMHLFDQTQLSAVLCGRFEKDAWQGFTAYLFEVGWAYFSLLNRSQIQDIFSFYRLSNKEKRFVQSVLDAFDVLTSTGWQAIDYFKFDLDVLLTAFQFAQLLGTSATDVTVQSITERKKTLVIQSKDELVVNGLDFIEWTDQKRGPWLKEVLDAVLLAVINRECKNERTNIKEWFHEFNKR